MVEFGLYTWRCDMWGSWYLDVMIELSCIWRDPRALVRF